MAVTESPNGNRISDSQWAILRTFLRPLPGAVYRSKKDLRQIVDAIRHKQHHDCAWEDLPRIFPPAAKVKQHYAIWQGDGTLDRISATLAAHTDSAPGADTSRPERETKGDGRIVIASQEVGPDGIRFTYRVAGETMFATVDFKELNSVLDANDPIQQKLLGILSIVTAVYFCKADDVNRVPPRKLLRPQCHVDVG